MSVRRRCKSLVFHHTGRDCWVFITHNEVTHPIWCMNRFVQPTQVNDRWYGSLSQWERGRLRSVIHKWVGWSFEHTPGCFDDLLTHHKAWPIRGVHRKDQLSDIKQGNQYHSTYTSYIKSGYRYLLPLRATWMLRFSSVHTFVSCQHGHLVSSLNDCHAVYLVSQIPDIYRRFSAVLRKQIFSIRGHSYSLSQCQADDSRLIGHLFEGYDKTVRPHAGTLLYYCIKSLRGLW